MKLTLYGSHLCQDTLYAICKLKDRNVEIDFKNISVDFSALKDFMKIRESDPVYEPVKKNGGLGMPLMILEDGTKTLDLEEVLKA